MIKSLINLMMILIVYIIEVSPLKAGCDIDYRPVMKNGELHCIDLLSPKDRAETTKRDRYRYLINKYKEEINKFEENEPELGPTKSNLVPKAKEPLFSDYQGKKTWQEAKEHCTGLGMRLPTEKEVAYAFQLALTKKWNGGIWVVWTDKENSSMNFKNHFNLYKKDSKLGFSCIDSSFSLTESQDKNLPIISKWIFSEYLGTMKWSDANLKCISSGMRLPSINELRLGDTENWIIGSYWMSNGGAYDIDPRPSPSRSSHPDDYLHVRCHR